MKNLFLLSTDKPSRVYSKSENYKLDISTMAMDWFISEGYKPQNIYITSDDEIKEGEWKIVKYKGQSPQVVKSEYANSVNNLYTLEYQAKIILTTDQELIINGIQAIDDEFLEWFVKNPSCEEVEIETYATNCSCENQTKNRFGDNKIDKNSTCHLRNKCNINYKIIIPKKEPKLCGGHLQFLGMVTPATEAYECIICRQEYRHTNTMGGNIFPLSKCTNGISQKEYLKIREGFKKSIDGQNHFIQHFKNGGTVKDFKPLEKVKQETLEEAKDRKYPLTNIVHLQLNTAIRTGFEEGANWQAERMYSEALEFGRWIIQNPDFQNDSSWSLETAKFNFEQFKKEMR